MLELPEALNIATQLRSAVAGRTVSHVLPPTSAHKFCWFCGEPEGYDGMLAGRTIASAEGFGSYAEITFDNGTKLCINDGVNVRLVQPGGMPKAYQLAICLEDGCALVFTVAMYGGIYAFTGSLDNTYYLKSRQAISPFAPEFEAYYRRVLAEGKPTLSAKALLATEQRFPGIGNGTVQDILFDARIHPKRKRSTLSEADADALLASLRRVLQSMIELGGRDTERDLYGAPGGYQTRMSKNTLASGCPVCGGAITKEAYLGGSVYYCSHCQPL